MLHTERAAHLLHWRVTLAHLLHLLHLFYVTLASQGSELLFAMCIGYTFRATPLNVLYHSACIPTSYLLAC